MKQNFEDYKFRCSQLYKINTGHIGLTNVQESRIKELENEKETGINVNGNRIKWTASKQEELEKLLYKQGLPLFEMLPATMKTELRAIHRAEKYSRNFPFTNKYVQKGLAQEEEAITTYDLYMKSLGHNILLMKNGTRLWNEDFQGEPDLRPFIFPYGEFKGLKCGVDTKCSWDLSTFPYPEDPLVEQYECQNQGYMDLEGADMWITCYVLTNGTEKHIHDEKMKWFYALSTQREGTPDRPDHPFYNEYIKKCKEVERMMIFSWDRFVEINPYHMLEHSREEWMAGGYDIPLEDRVIEKISLRDEYKLSYLKERVKIAREYLVHLDKQ